MSKLNFTKLELGIVAFGVCLFAGSSALYVSDFPIRNYVLGLEEEGGQVEVGKLGHATGSVRRQISGESDFREVGATAPLFNMDTIVTPPEGSATVLLGDGSKIELGPSTMVRLAFELQLSLGGIFRAANVEVVTGSVTGEAKTRKIVVRSRGKAVTITKASPKQVIKAELPAPPPPPKPRPVQVAAVPSPSPSPSPSPLLPARESVRAQILAPRVGEAFKVAKGSTAPKVPVLIGWSVTPPKSDVKVTLLRLPAAGKAGAAKAPAPVLEKVMPTPEEKGALNLVLTSPGEYELILTNPADAVPAMTDPNAARARFKVEREFEALEVLVPLIGGKPGTSNLLEGELRSDFDIAFRWKNFPAAKGYKIRIGTTAQALLTKPLLERSTSKNQYFFNKDKVYNGQIFYTVSAELPSGFVAKSPLTAFSFNFLPPSPSTPKNKAVIPKDEVNSQGGTVLLTWKKTNFTSAYEIEVSSDPGFATPLVKKKIKENFFILRVQGGGTYYWRLRSYATNGIVSPPSQYFELKTGI